MPNQTILIVEDEAEIREGIRILLSGENYSILEAENGEQALSQMSDQIDLVILDVMMPGISGLRVCEEIRKTSTVPILFLTAKAQESDKLIGLTAGGDDYLVKPFSYAELIARVKALLRRYCVYQGKGQPGATYEDDMLSAQGITIALDHNQVWVRGEERDLTEIEYQILRLLMRRPQWIFSAQAIYESIWNEPYFPISNGTVMVHIRKLRTKIEDDPKTPSLSRPCGARATALAGRNAMSRNKLKRGKTHKSILAQFFLLLVGLGLLCGALFLVLHTTVGSALESYVYSSDFLSNVTEKRVNDLQEYVTENQVSATDSQALSQWMRGKPLTLMEIYRSNVLVYSSYASYSLSVEEDDFTWTATEGEEVPTYDWISYYTVDFADGQAEVVLYSNDLYRYSTYATIAEILLCAALFLLGFLVAFQRTVSYMRQISLEIQAMEGGDLGRPITVRGNNDLTALAESLDAMRLAFRTQQELEASTYAANQALISQMSHDLRTPLTTLLIYTEILRYGKYQGEEQLRGYLDKIDEKAQQIKQLAENLLEYSLASQNREVEMEPPAPAAGIFQPLLQETATFLEQYGYTFQWDLAFGEGKVAVHTPYLRRILDNLSSNILKYASLQEPVFIQAREQEGTLVFSFRNALKEREGPTEGTCVGLSSVDAMMGKMGGSSHAEQTGKTFQITLVFPLAGHGTS